MSKQAEPEYRTAYAEHGKKICPETGADLSGMSRASILAHAENLYPTYAEDNFSEEAKERREILRKIAKEADE
jgi:hypothetical protein